MNDNEIKFSPIDIEKRKNLDVRPGDEARVFYKVKEGDKERVQELEGLVIARKHGLEPGATFTLRKIYQGIGVEHIFPFYSPNIEKIEILRHSKVRRAKLYFVRRKTQREIRRKMRRIKIEKPFIAAETKEEEAAH